MYTFYNFICSHGIERLQLRHYNDLCRDLCCLLCLHVFLIWAHSLWRDFNLLPSFQFSFSWHHHLSAPTFISSASLSCLYSTPKLAISHSLIYNCNPSMTPLSHSTHSQSLKITLFYQKNSMLFICVFVFHFSLHIQRYLTNHLHSIFWLVLLLLLLVAIAVVLGCHIR